MTAFTANERRVVPRWREFLGTLKASRELARVAGPGQVPDPIGEFENLKATWRTRPSTTAARDLVSTAVVLRRLEEVPEAIDFIRRSADISDEFRCAVLSDNNVLEDATSIISELSDQGKIAYLKQVVRTWPRNAIGWTQLALHYCRLGVNHKASRCIDIALALSPNNRYVLRSACRFFVHTNDAQRAVWQLRRSPRTKGDPWLLAPEIACSHILGEASPLIRHGSRILEAGSFPPWFVTELGASIGTFELENGSRRKARRSLKVGAQEPNDNVKAQLQWLRIDHSDMVTSKEADLADYRDHEARALSCRVEQDWSGTVAGCEQWGVEECFSERPFSLGSYVAIEALGDPVQAERLLRAGLVANRQDALLLNNLAIALAMQGKTDDARVAMSDANRNSGGLPLEDTLALMATDGLIEYRAGNVARGRSFYWDAIGRAKENDLGGVARRAALYFVLEELEAGTEDSVWLSKTVLEKVGRATVKDRWPERKALLDRVSTAIGKRSRSLESSDSGFGNRLVKLIP